MSDGSLKARLKAEIEAAGPISIPAYMLRCLHDPVHGYYATRPRLGADGDFITAPLVSQMFGELIGVWAVETWRRLGKPSPFHLVELGPGDATLMSDALRAGRIDPNFLSACCVTLVETSPLLIEQQRRRLAEAAVPIVWANDLDGLSDGPMLLIANEFLDCLPATQLVRTVSGWAEQRVGLDQAGELCFGLASLPLDPPAGLEAAKVGDLWEVSPLQMELGRQVAQRIRQFDGAALFLDYGRATRGPGDTLQALIRHERADPLSSPGQADLTMWADFPSLIEGVAEGGVAVSGPIDQGRFLRRLGIDARAARLARSRPDGSAKIARQVARLTDHDQMGDLFKVCAVHRAGLAPPGFEE